MNWRIELFTKISEKLTPLKDSGRLKFIDLNKGQFDQPSKTFPIPRPAVLIDILSSGDNTHLTNEWVEGDNTMIGLLLVLDNRNLSFVGSESFADSLEILEFIQTVVDTVTFLSGETFTDLHYLNDTKQPNQFDGLQRHLITFTTSLYYQLNIN